MHLVSWAYGTCEMMVSWLSKHWLDTYKEFFHGVHTLWCILFVEIGKKCEPQLPLCNIIMNLCSFHPEGHIRLIKKCLQLEGVYEGREEVVESVLESVVNAVITVRDWHMVQWKHLIMWHKPRSSSMRSTWGAWGKVALFVGVHHCKSFL